MSFRELRNFCEMMRSLGYPRLISVDNFRTPNFRLVADTLFWLVRRYDSSIDVPEEIDDENDRVQFIVSVASQLLLKARLKLNTKRLYASDGRAVRELNKIAELLYEAKRLSLDTTIEEGEEPVPLTSAVKDLKNARALATEITDRGAKLYDLLGDEPDLRVDRSKALQFLEAISSNLSSTKEHQYIEQQLNELVQNVNDNVEQMTKQSAELDADESGLTGKIKKKQQDLDRNEKRLKSLKTVRPAFMDEYERLEKDLEVLYGTYLQKFRNLDYLEAELATLREVEKESMKVGERQMQRMQKRLREEELRIMRGEATANDSMDADAVPNARGKGVGASMNRNRPGSASKKDNYRGGNNRGGGRGNVHGNMGGGDLSDEESTGSEGLSDDSRSNSGSGSGSSDEVSLGSGAEDSDQMLSDSASGSEDLSDDVSGSGSSDNEF